MCCTIEPAELSNTIIYAAETIKDGEVRHVVGYQNAVRLSSWGNTKNAMLLPFPAEGKVGRENLVNGSAFKGILKSYEKAVDRLRPRNRSFSKSFREDDSDYLGAVAAASYDIFESGSYTIVLAEKAAGIAVALKDIPADKRPVVPTRFLIAMGSMYPNWPMALCCFNQTMEEVEPLFWWYKPKYPSVLFAPAIDAHDGGPPKLGQQVKRDHTLAFASHASRRVLDRELQGDIFNQVPQEHQWLFDARVCGRQITDSSLNGDFVYTLDQVRDKEREAWLPVQVSAPPQSLATWPIL